MKNFEQIMKWTHPFGVFLLAVSGVIAAFVAVIKIIRQCNKQNVSGSGF